VPASIAGCGAGRPAVSRLARFSPSMVQFDTISAVSGLLRAGGNIGTLSALMALQLERSRGLGVLRANGLTPLPSAANFVAVDCGRDGAFAKRVLDELAARDVFVRMPFVEPQNRCIRISAGTEKDLDLLETVLPDALVAADG